MYRRHSWHTPDAHFISKDSRKQTMCETISYRINYHLIFQPSLILTTLTCYKAMLHGTVAGNQQRRYHGTIVQLLQPSHHLQLGVSASFEACPQSFFPSVPPILLAHCTWTAHKWMNVHHHSYVPFVNDAGTSMPLSSHGLCSTGLWPVNFPVL